MTRDTFDISLGAAAQGLLCSVLIVLLSLICRSIARERILLGLVLTGSDSASLGSIDSIRDQCCRIFFIFCVLFSFGAASGASAACNRGNHLWVVGWHRMVGGGADRCQA